MRTVLGVFVFFAALQAQWLNHPTPGIPRMADGKPNVTAPAPRMPDGKPDLTGLWGMDSGSYQGNVAIDLKPEDVKPWSADLFKQRQADLGKDSPTSRCLPFGPRVDRSDAYMKQFIQTPGRLVVLIEDLTYRQIFLDGRELPKDPDPSFMGYSVGHWEGDTLVVETTGFKEAAWLDGGHPFTDALRVTERFHRTDFGHMEITETIDDPGAFNRKFTIPIRADLIPDTEILEYVCAENERDHQHLVGAVSISKPAPVKVAPEALAKYVGAYKFAYPETPTVFRTQNITLSDGTLYFDLEGKNRAALVPVSETRFLRGEVPIDFVKNERGEVTHFTTAFAEGDLKSIRSTSAK